MTAWTYLTSGHTGAGARSKMSVWNFYSPPSEQLLTPMIQSQSGVLTGWKHDSWLAADHKKSRTAAQLREVGVEVGL